eukprot:35417-Pyramimonas_sp.AAC.1
MVTLAPHRLHRIAYAAHFARDIVHRVECAQHRLHHVAYSTFSAPSSSHHVAYITSIAPRRILERAAWGWHCPTYARTCM